MISVIVCSRQDPSRNLHERNARKTAGEEIEYVRIDNRESRYGICAAYNAGVERAGGEILVFMHEDAFFVESNWAGALFKKFSDESVGMIGIAGTQYLLAEAPLWNAAGRPFVKGWVIHETDNGKAFELTVYSWDKKDSEVVAVDGVFFAVRKALFSTVRFDGETFDGFHFYDLDLCMQVRRTSRVMVTPEILIKHQSGGSIDATWEKYARRFIEKFHNNLPVSCTNDVPSLSRRIPFVSYDLKGKVPQVTIC